MGMLKTCNKFSETIFSDLFIGKENTYNFGRNKKNFKYWEQTQCGTFLIQLDILDHLSGIPSITNYFLYISSLEIKNEIHKWKPKKCSCRICKTFFPTLREKCPNTEFFLVRMRENTDHKKLRIWTLFMQCKHRFLQYDGILYNIFGVNLTFLKIRIK